jgi:hypothetical protein
MRPSIACMVPGENIDGGVVCKAAVDDDNATREMLVAPRRGNKEQASPDTLMGMFCPEQEGAWTVCQPLSRVVSLVRCIAAAARSYLRDAPT